MRRLICFCFSLFYIYGEQTQALHVTTDLPDNVAALLNVTDQQMSELMNSSRRIINGEEVFDGFRYMVYLQLAETNAKKTAYSKWVCAGVIVHEEYILTSAACIEDAQHFYVISGTYRYSDTGSAKNNACIRNGRKKAIWKCVPKNYIFDGHENDVIRWMNNDIAVVRVADGFDFGRRVKGCEFIPAPIMYNNSSRIYESPNTIATIAGWGTRTKYNEWLSRRSDNQQRLLQATVEVISKRRCKQRWGPRYTNIIENYMICSRDIGHAMSDMCESKYVQCKDLDYSSEEVTARRTIKVIDPAQLTVHSYHNGSMGPTRRQKAVANGGFCENDHGGPIVYGTGDNAMVIGIITACLTHEITNKCYGPFLYTSVYKNRQFINCAIFKDVEKTCRRQFRHGVTQTETIFSWENLTDDGPEKPVFEDDAKEPHKTSVPLEAELEDLSDGISIELPHA